MIQAKKSSGVGFNLGESSSWKQFHQFWNSPRYLKTKWPAFRTLGLELSTFLSLLVNKRGLAEKDGDVSEDGHFTIFKFNFRSDTGVGPVRQGQLLQKLAQAGCLEFHDCNKFWRILLHYRRIQFLLDSKAPHTKKRKIETRPPLFS